MITDTSNGCSDDTTIKAEEDTAKPNPSIASINPLTCDSNSIMVDASGSEPSGDITYSWSGNTFDDSNGDSSIVHVTEEGNTTLSITDTSNGCQTDTTFNVAIDTTSPDVLINTPNTLTCENNEVALDASSSSGDSYSWFTSNGNIISGTNSDIALVDAAGDYTLVVTASSNGCTDTANVTVNENMSFPDALFEASEDSGMAPLEVSFTDQSFGADLWEWDFGNGETSEDSTTSTTYEELGTYTTWLTITDTSNGCKDSTSKRIFVDSESMLDVPNVFSPNGDDMNDQFEAEHKNISSFEMQIFNRWGQKLIEINNIKQGWNGFTSSGKKASEGTYYYIIKAKGVDGVEYNETGSLTLFR
ncbi:MAG: gliding motility-associated C-terminal domain-containing protein [Flavobacteriales bacterium]